jgi:hypothetical protein
MIRTYVKFSFYLLLSLLPSLSIAQSATISPYSRYGIGDVQPQTGAQGFAMGNTGTAMHGDSVTPFFINLKNPASYFYNRITTFEAGILNNNVTLSTVSDKHTDHNTYFGYFAIAFPVTKWASASLGLTPMSNVGYNISATSNIDSLAPNGQLYPIGAANTYYSGSGGINNIFLGLAISPDKNHRLSIGAHLSYLFGNITYSQILVYPSNYSSFNSESVQNAHIKGLYLNYGIMYTIGKETGWHATIGLTAGLASNIGATYNLLSVNNLGGLIYDTIQDSNVSGTIRLPLMIGGGFALKKGQQWTFTFDYSMQNWSQYTYFGQQQSLNDSKQYNFGLEYVPHKNSELPHSFFQKVHYRAGFSYNQTSLDLNNTAINDYCATLGFGLPVGRNDILFRASMLNIGLQVGQLGTTSNNLLQERYFKVLFSFTFDDRWFIKRQFQ